MSNSYDPSQWYVIQSGKRKGEALELLMFKDYHFLCWFKENKLKGGKNKNKLQLHLEWLLRQGETRQTKMLCPFCKSEPVKYFSVAYSFNDFSVGSGYTCCRKKECIESLRGMAMGKPVTLLEFKFSNLRRFNKTDARTRISELYRKAFGLDKPLTRKRAFQFFKE